MTPSERFVKNIKSSIETWRMPPETEALYVNKLSEYNELLNEKQWADALGLILIANKSGKLIPLPIILEALDNQVIRKKLPTAKAKFDLDGYTRVIFCEGRPIKSGSSMVVWVIADKVTHDSQGNEIHWQQHVGEPVTNHIPAKAINYDIFPDDPAPPKPEDVPTQEEIHELVERTISRIGDL